MEQNAENEGQYIGKWDPNIENNLCQVLEICILLLLHSTIHWIWQMTFIQNANIVMDDKASICQI